MIIDWCIWYDIDNALPPYEVNVLLAVKTSGGEIEYTVGKLISCTTKFTIEGNTYTLEWKTIDENPYPVIAWMEIPQYNPGEREAARSRERKGE